ncbi:hypothetical protein RhiJN_17979 [Ceratobasidium sp. AG-Ba]|nr:hypothetical protein RhiJN_17979 [Ceratobasidium sp. AG-Ba]
MFARFVTVSMLGALTALGTVEATGIDASFDASFGLSIGSSSCQNGYFWYDRLSCCLKNGGESTTPPSGSSCPSNFYWHTTENCCVPTSSDPIQQMPSSCPDLSIWDILTWSCKPLSPPTPTTCGSGFWWGALNTCVSIGGTGYTPPSGYSCPDEWTLHPAVTTGSGTLENNAASQAEAEAILPLRTILVTTVANVMSRYTNALRFALAPMRLAPSLVRLSMNALTLVQS